MSDRAVSLVRRRASGVFRVQKNRLRLAAGFEHLRESLWFIPGLMIAAALSFGAALANRTGPAPELRIVRFLLPATVEGARAVLQVVTASVITVTSVVFSLTLVALQITASNYSPRVLRTFLRDVGTQIVLGTFLATFTFCYIVLQNASTAPDGLEPAWGPQTAFLAVPLFVLSSMGALVFFIHHVTQSIRVDLILQEVLEESLETIDRVHPEMNHAVTESFDPTVDVPAGAVAVTAASSGFVQTYGTKELVEALSEKDLVAAFVPTVGDHVLSGTVLAWVWSDDSLPPDGIPFQAICDAVQLGDGRTMQQDVVFGLRQLVDVAVRALSPGVNDPNTAVTTIAHLAVAYGTLATRHVGTQIERDGDAVTRVLLSRPTFADYLHIACQQIGHYGSGDVMVMLRLMKMLGELKVVSCEDNRPAIDSAIARVLEEGRVGLALEADRTTLAAAAEQALEGVTMPRHRTAAG